MIENSLGRKKQRRDRAGSSCEATLKLEHLLQNDFDIMDIMTFATDTATKLGPVGQSCDEIRREPKVMRSGGGKGYAMYLTLYLIVAVICYVHRPARARVPHTHPVPTKLRISIRRCGTPDVTFHRAPAAALSLTVAYPQRRLKLSSP